jgi:hypothetical protein
MNTLVGWLFLILLLAMVSGGRNEETANPTVVVNAGVPERNRSGAGSVIVFLAMMWLVAYMFTNLA